MQLNLDNFTELTGEVNCTRMVEEWDFECGTGEETISEDHPAWEIAVEVSERTINV